MAVDSVVFGGGGGSLSTRPHAQPLAYAQPTLHPNHAHVHVPSIPAGYAPPSHDHISMYLLQKQVIDNQTELNNAESSRMQRLQARSQLLEQQLRTAQDQAELARLYGFVSHALTLVLCLSLLASASRILVHATDSPQSREEAQSRSAPSPTPSAPCVADPLRACVASNQSLSPRSLRADGRSKLLTPLPRAGKIRGRWAAGDGRRALDGPTGALVSRRGVRAWGLSNTQRGALTVDCIHSTSTQLLPSCVYVLVLLVHMLDCTVVILTRSSILLYVYVSITAVHCHI